MHVLDALLDAYYAEWRIKNTSGGRLHVVGVQWRKGGPVIRVTDADLSKAVREALNEAQGLSVRPFVGAREHTVTRARPSRDARNTTSGSDHD